MPTAPIPIVVACDGSPAALHAAEFVAVYRSDAARLIPRVVNVQHPPLTLFPGSGIGRRQLDTALQAQGMRELSPALARLTQAGLSPEPVVRQGFAAAALLEEALASGARAIVVGTRGRGVLRGFALGSVAMRVVHAGAMPAFLVGPEARLPAQWGRKLRVLLATDGSEYSARAAALLVDWREWLGEMEVRLVHARSLLTLGEAVLPPHQDVIDRWSGADTEEAVRPARELLAGAGMLQQVHLVEGDPAGEIVRLAQETACELVVLGTRGHGAAHHALIGSVALNVAALSPVPLLLVP